MLISTVSPARKRIANVFAVFVLVVACKTLAQDDLADYPIKEEQCENFGECLTECVKKLPPNRQFTEIVIHIYYLM
jgi:hypothetical protein